MEPTVKMGHASSAMERRARRAQDAAGEERQAVTPRGQNEAIQEKRSLGVYLDRGREWLREMGGRLRQGSELAAHGMTRLVQGPRGRCEPNWRGVRRGHGVRDRGAGTPTGADTGTGDRGSGAAGARPAAGAIVRARRDGYRVRAVVCLHRSTSVKNRRLNCLEHYFLRYLSSGRLG